MKQKLNLKQRWVVVGMDVLLLAELTFSIYLGHQNPEVLTGIFLRTFIPLALGTVIASRLLMKKFRTRESLATDSL